MTMPDSLADDLCEHLFITMDNMPRDERRHARWVMNLEWLNEVRKISTIGPLWSPGVMVEPDTLMGLPVEIRDDGGVPHLEAPE